MTTVVSNSTCLIAFKKINSLDLLEKLFGEVFIPQKVGFEIKKELNFFPIWIKIEAIVDRKLYNKIIADSLDEGEAEAIVLASYKPDALLILDEKIARKYVQEKLKIPVMGSCGILLKLKEKGIIKDVKSYLDKLRLGIWISDCLYKKTLELAKENP